MLGLSDSRVERVGNQKNSSVGLGIYHVYDKAGLQKAP